ncbi:putative inactive heme oxygenase 2, chloroplastic [Cinnamomum micranthum f. kanehirae]|uniref:Putative inactive heme oxygenase 2, chloroplastic n=1 Tax=Cinnamomum micranthum f. kanehirae TaxID=337451 RepID=A0A3S3NCR0_9MAGN|nr:putative inactive heme oxygenase 2, chloroplastic [Cinnamomum micranthum f. kanehirae]
MWSSPAASTTLSSRMLETPIISFYSRSVYPPTLYVSFPYKPQFIEKNQTCIRSRNRDGNFISCCSSTDTDTHMLPSTTPTKTVVSGKRKRYRKQYPGESKGIVEEMRFVGMKLRNNYNKKGGQGGAEMSEDEEAAPSSSGNDDDDDDDDDATWQPTTEGFVKYLVDSKLVFETLDRIIDESNHVAYSYFRKTGLERSQGLSKDLEWFSQQNIVIPPPSTPGISYAEYLDKLANQCAPAFLGHFYNIYFAHITGGEVIGKQLLLSCFLDFASAHYWVSDKLLDGRELEFYKWEGDVSEMLKDVRVKLNKLAEHWTREQKSRCLKAAAKSFRFSGQLIRLIIL